MSLKRILSVDSPMRTIIMKQTRAISMGRLPPQPSSYGNRSGGLYKEYNSHISAKARPRAISATMTRQISSSLQISLQNPQYISINKGEQSSRSGPEYAVDKHGSFFLRFAPVIDGTQPRNYDWVNGGETFKISVAEMGEIIAAISSNSQAEFFHVTGGNINNTRTGSGEVQKALRFAPGTNKDGSWFLNLKVTRSSRDANTFSIPLSRGEVVIFESVLRFFIPHAIGFGAVIAKGDSSSEQ